MPTTRTATPTATPIVAAPRPPDVRVLDADACYAAIQSRDSRFDGAFVTAVRTTGIYCRPSCPALTPRRANVHFLRTSAAAQRAGFRACKRCRPDAAPGSAEWDVRADLVGRAMHLIDDGVIDRAGVEGLAVQLGYSPRQLRRHLLDQLGAGPLTLARAGRARTARLLLESTDLTVADVAFAAGFGSIRQCNDTIRAVYAATPSALRMTASRARKVREPAGGLHTLVLRLACRQPSSVAATLAFLGAHAVAGIETYDSGIEACGSEIGGDAHQATYRRSMALPHGPAVVALSADSGGVRAELALADLRDLAAAVARCRRLLDLDADPVAVDNHLSTDPHLAPLVRRFPGRRVAGTHDGAEVAIRTVLGQQISLAAARRLGADLVNRCGSRLPEPQAGITHLFPQPAAIAALTPADLPMPRARSQALVGLAKALAGGLRLDPGVDRDHAEAALVILPGIGPWTARYIRMRALADPDILLVEDLAVRRAAIEIGLPGTAAELTRRSAPWSPWGSYATGLLYAHVLEGKPA